MRLLLLTVSAAVWFATATPIVAAPSCTAQSGRQTAVLLELYTSEGCSSCPPADKWLHRLNAKGLVGERVVPLALHVDYWNDLGWQDPFSQEAFTRRQYRFAALRGKRTVYTPQFLLNGREYRRWTSGGIGRALAAINRLPARARLQLALRENSGQGFAVTGEVDVIDAARADGDVYLAVYENNLLSKVDAGENSGRTLHHDFVVRRLIGPIAVDRSGDMRLHEDVRLETAWKRRDLGVAGFVQNRRTGEILQAISLPLCF